jgi:hypothetical protein
VEVALILKESMGSHNLTPQELVQYLTGLTLPMCCWSILTVILCSLQSLNGHIDFGEVNVEEAELLKY